MPCAQRVPRLLAAMAHPDDAEILVGGTLFHLKELAWELGILTMTAWAKGFGRECGSAQSTTSTELGTKNFLCEI